LTGEQRPLLSIIIPAYNEERRLPLSLASIDKFLQRQPYDAEVIVVENGSRDRTAEIVREFAAAGHPYIRLMEVETRGKGLAVKQGMLAARGEYRFMCDADLSMRIEELEKFIPLMRDEGYDIVIASREAEGAQRVNEPEYRHLMGRVNNWLIKIMATNAFEDTQCGFKMFRREVAEDLFSVQRTNGIGFDVELLFIAQKRGYRIYELPITWYFDPESKMRLIDDSLAMLREIWDIRQNWRKGLYHERPNTGETAPTEG
jgi:glycosyltransferase involved in cell wall biosynthesis